MKFFKNLTMLAIVILVSSTVLAATLIVDPNQIIAEPYAKFNSLAGNNFNCGTVYSVQIVSDNYSDIYKSKCMFSCRDNLSAVNAEVLRVNTLINEARKQGKKIQIGGFTLANVVSEAASICNEVGLPIKIVEE